MDDQAVQNLSARTTKEEPNPSRSHGAPEWTKDWALVNPFDQLEKLGAGKVQRTPFDADLYRPGDS